MRTFLSFDAQDGNGLQLEKNGQHRRLTLNIWSILVDYTRGVYQILRISNAKGSVYFKTDLIPYITDYSYCFKSFVNTMQKRKMFKVPMLQL